MDAERERDKGREREVLFKKQNKHKKGKVLN